MRWVGPGQRQGAAIATGLAIVAIFPRIPRVPIFSSPGTVRTIECAGRRVVTLATSGSGSSGTTVLAVRSGLPRKVYR